MSYGSAHLEDELVGLATRLADVEDRLAMSPRRQLTSPPDEALELIAAQRLAIDLLSTRVDALHQQNRQLTDAIFGLLMDNTGTT